MQTFAAGDLRRLGEALLKRVGVPPADAALVADHLVEANLLGHDTHGVLRLPQYVEMVRSGQVHPGAPLQVEAESPSTAQVSGGWDFGPVTATRAMGIAIGKAREAAVGVVTVRQCNHVGRLGRFSALAARERMIGLLAANGHGGDLAVAPFGGLERRLGTNPLSIAVPTGRPWPVVLDMTTSALSGGQLRLLRNLGQAAPPDTLVDAQGRATMDVEAYYGPPAGAILPLGFPLSGHKGYGLGVMVDVLAGALSGAGCSGPRPARIGNALFAVVLRVEAFVPWEEYQTQAEGLLGRLESCPPSPGFDRVELPGGRAFARQQQRRDQGVPVDAAAWRQISALAGELGVDLPSGRS
ncbi:MAG: Ldh family oxidoreductase [Candidatus Latescibacterota bacterium]